jgi:ABC-type transport system substrate-binding protein
VIQTGGVFKRAAASQLTLIRFPWNSAGNNGTIDPTGYMYNCLTQYGGVQLNETANRFWEYANPDWEIKPDVAESWETPDNLTWVFNIKSNVMFHDGRAFTADDAAHSYEAIRDQGVSGGGSPAFNLGKVIAGTESIDDLTMRLNLGEPRWKKSRPASS